MAQVGEARGRATGVSGGGGGRSAPVRPGTGLILLVAEPASDLSDVIRSLRSRGLRGVLTPLRESVYDIVSVWNPRAVVVFAGAESWLELLIFLRARRIPTVVVGTPAQLRAAGEAEAESVGVLAPAEPSEVAETVELIVGPLDEPLPDTIDAGDLRIDVRSRLVHVDGTELRLPPKEFDILVQLALRPGEPVPARELLHKVWPENPAATNEDLHCRVARLRAPIDQSRDLTRQLLDIPVNVAERRSRPGT